jgi:thiol:disulfide interchange protein
MRGRYFFILTIIAATGLFFSLAQAAEKIKDDFVEIELIFQHEPVAPDSNSAVRIKFNLEKDWHFYADKNTAPQQMALKIIPQGQELVFSKPVMPPSNSYFDKITNSKLAVYSGNFSIFIPFVTDANSRSTEVKILIDGLACSRQLCRKTSYELSKRLDISASADMANAKFSVPAENIGGTDFENLQTSAIVALPLAIVAGLLLNIMPCVWPVLPIIVMRLVSQAEKSRAKSIALGLSFAAGIVLFFAALAVISIILKLGFGIVFQWGDQFRNSAFVIAMALLMVVLALYMFGLFTFGLPASITGQRGQRAGFAGSLGMGFLAAVLSTPCSFAILAFVLAWAQTQPIPLATITILLVGTGMALPYVILVTVPKLLEKIPKPGRWMELFRHATGFILLAIGVKLLEAVQPEKIINILYYAVVLAVCVWMWGVWVGYSTPAVKKWTVRTIAAAAAVIFGFVFLTEPKKGLINWQDYDAEIIASAQKAQRPVLIKFTADWCFSCKILDKTVYSSDKIADLIKRKGVLAIKADTTQFDYPAAAALKEIYNEPAVPVTVLLLPGKERPEKIPGNLIKGKLIKYLQSLDNVEE